MGILVIEYFGADIELPDDALVIDSHDVGTVGRHVVSSISNQRNG